MSKNLKILILSLLPAMVLFFILISLNGEALNGEGSRGDPEYGVEVKADDTADHTDPGDSVVFRLELLNNGTANDTYALILLKEDKNMSARDWSWIAGVDSNNSISIPSGETKFLDVVVDVPEFTPESDDALEGRYDFKVLAQSTSNGSVMDSVVFEVNVEALYNLKVWCDFPVKNGTLVGNSDMEMTYTINVRNLGNTEDEIVVEVPADELCRCAGRDWEVKFGTQPSRTLSLAPLETAQTAMIVIIDKSTDPGEYSLQVRAESQGDTSVYRYTPIYINISKAVYGVELQKISSIHRRCNPADESEIEFRFTLTNTGNVNDSYNVEVETPLGSGTYKDWIMEFENKDYERVDEINVPADLRGQTDTELPKNGRIDITLYVVVALDEDEDFYEDIWVSATSNSDNTVIDYLNFNLTVILPNIRLSDDLEDFNIDPDSDIEEGDSIDINLRIYNDGNAETDSFYVFFYNGKKNSPNEQAGNYIAFEKVDNIPANSYFDVLATWDDIEGGENDIFAYADKPIRSDPGATRDPFGNFLVDGFVFESRENDNTASIAQKYEDAIYLGPDLTITKIDFDDHLNGKETTVTVTVRNVGSTKALRGSATVQIRIGGDPIKDRTGNRVIPTINDDIEVDDDIKMEFVWDTGDIEEAMNLTVKATVDHPDDPNSANDKMTTYIRGADIDLPPRPSPPIYDYPGFYPFLLGGLILSFLIIFLIFRHPKMKPSKKFNASQESRLKSSRMINATKGRYDHVSPYASPGPQWTCSRCGNSWSSEKTLCWNCGKKRY